MELRDPFVERDGQIAIDLPEARAVLTTRAWGDVRETGPEIARRLGVRPVRPKQVHGDQVITVSTEAQAPAEADAVVTTTRGLAPMVITADCLPIVVAAPQAVASIHAGWRGLDAGLIARAVARVRELSGGVIHAAIGPGAGACCYEVGDDLHRRFGARSQDFRHGRNLDLKAIARVQLMEAGVARVHDSGICTICGEPELTFSYRREGPETGRQAVLAWFDLIHGLRAEDVRANLELVRERLRTAGRDPAEVQILAAVKYLPAEELGALADGGITLVGENRAQELEAKAAAHPDFTWDFIGTLQSRKVAALLPRVRYIHSVASDSALQQLARHGTPDTRILVEVNVAGDPSKAGVAPGELPAFLERCPVKVAGLMTMPPLAADPEQNRPHFAALRELAAHHGLAELSMGSSQDYAVAAEEGATIIRLGSLLFRRRAA